MKQITIFEYLEEKNKIFEIDIRGLLDDGYCPKCGYAFKDWMGEVDIDCPECHARIDWTRWHTMND